MRTRALLGLLALSFVGCDDDPVVTDAGAICASDSDCDDLVWCNGTESCDPFSPSADVRGCLPGIRPCGPGEGCDEETEECGPSCSEPDADGDGADALECGGSDCDDRDPLRSPDAEEVCDSEGRDEDCDPTTLGDRDIDGDGFGDARCCNGDRCGEDCDEARASTNPSQPESCDGLDNDCDGTVDEELLESRFADRDRDRYGDPDEAIMACPGAIGTSPSSLDCDDANVAVSLPQGEIIDGEDNDCDGVVDENPVEVLWYADEDGDGYGDARSDTVLSSRLQEGRSIAPTDCDDGDADRNPLAPELCNAIDDDCSGEPNYQIGINDWEDDDGDGYADMACPGGGGTDCDDRDPATRPGQFELCDLRDNDCDGRVDESCSDTMPDAGTPMDAGPPRVTVSWPFTLGGAAPTADRCAAARITTVRFTLTADGTLVAEADCADGEVALEVAPGTSGEGLLEPLDERGVTVPTTAGLDERAMESVAVAEDALVVFLPSADFGAERPSSWEVCDGFDNDGDGSDATSCAATIVDVAVPAGGEEACAVRERGDVVCWNGTTSGGVPTAETDVNYVVDIAMGTASNGQTQSCVLFFDGRVGCKGPGFFGSLGVPESELDSCSAGGDTYPCSNEYRVVPGVEDATAIGVGEDFACALLGSEEVSCWGSSANGRTGSGIDPTAPATAVPPTVVSGPTFVRALSVGARGACASFLLANPPQCWGAGEILGDNGGNDSSTPGAVSSWSSAFSLSAPLLSVGSEHVCADSKEGTTVCWGRRTSGQLGDGMATATPEVVLTPQTVNGVPAPRRLGAGPLVTVIADASQVYYWGSDTVFGPSTADGYYDTPQTLTVPAASLDQIVSGGWACFRYTDGSVQCFGPGSDEGAVNL